MKKAIKSLEKRMKTEECIQREYLKIGDRKMGAIHIKNADAIDYVISILKDSQ